MFVNKVDMHFELPVYLRFRTNSDATLRHDRHTRTPEDLGQSFDSHGNLSRRALKSLALEEFRVGRLSQAQLRLLLGFSTRYELDGFLKAHEVYVDYTIDEFEHDQQALRQAGF